MGTGHAVHSARNKLVAAFLASVLVTYFALKGAALTTTTTDNNNNNNNNGGGDAGATHICAQCPPCPAAADASSIVPASSSDGHSHFEAKYGAHTHSIVMGDTATHRHGVHIVCDFFRTRVPPVSATADADSEEMRVHNLLVLRQIELLQTLQANVQHPWVASIDVIVDAAADLQFLKDQHLFDPLQKLNLVHLPGVRMRYASTFEYTKAPRFAGKVVMIMNSDIVLGENFGLVADPRLYGEEGEWRGHGKGKKKFVGLSRGELDTPCPPLSKDQCENYKGSHDAFLFVAPPPPTLSLAGLNFTSNHPGAENVVIYEMNKAGMSGR
jgi:hypothetical protein